VVALQTVKNNKSNLKSGSILWKKGAIVGSEDFTCPVTGDKGVSVSYKFPIRFLTNFPQEIKISTILASLEKCFEGDTMSYYQRIQWFLFTINSKDNTEGIISVQAIFMKK
jgi:hypothetical protein